MKPQPLDVHNSNLMKSVFSILLSCCLIVEHFVKSL